MIEIEVALAEKCTGNFSLFISSPYDPELISIIKEYSNRWWHNDTKMWELPYNVLDSFSSKLSALDKEFTIYNEDIAKKPEVNVSRETFDFKTKPFSHQIEGFNYGISHNKWLLGDEQGLGKTKQVIDIAVAKKQQENYKHCLIICGVNGLKWNWKNEIATHSQENSLILGEIKKGNRIVIGSNNDKLAALKSLKNDSPYFLITNIESLRNDDITNEIVKLCKDGTINMIAADEVHKMKNPSSQQGKAFLKLSAETMIAMTGTPLMNTPLDLYIILKWLGYEKHSFYAFKQYYCIMGGYGDYQIVGYKHLDELQEHLNTIMLRRLKKDVLDLPDKLYVNEYVEMTGKQEQVYNEITMDIKAHIDEIAMSNNPLAELIRLRQATGYTGILSSTIKESAKLDRMEELVEEAISNGQKIVIFSNWTSIIDAVIDRLVHYKPLIITGETSDAVRQGMVDRFQINDEYKVILGTIGAMGTGLTLTAGTVVIFMDEPWSKALKEQAEDRCHRVGTKENITIYTLICKDTIDEKIHEIVEKKGLMANAIVDNTILVDKVELINYLLS